MDQNDHRRLTTLSEAISRRAAIRGLGGAGVATALGITAHDRTGAQTPVGAPAGATSIEPDAGSWKTWVLSSGDQLRPGGQPDAAATDAELAEMAAMSTSRSAETTDRISYWDAGSPGYRWNEIAMRHTLTAGQGPGEAYRAMALLNAAIYDATIAAWDAKYAFGRPRPATTDPTLATAIPTPASPSYPCEHAVTAGAAAAVLGYLFPDDAESLADLAKEAAQSRVAAGVAYPSDSAAGLEVGKRVGELFVAHADADGSDAPFDPMTMPTGDGLWNGDPASLVYPTLGTWETWVLSSGDQFRPDPPPAADSAERAAELEEVINYARDANPATELFFWPPDPAGRPRPDTVPISSNQLVFYYAPVLHFVWGPELSQKLSEYRWDVNPPRAARAYALVSIAGYDATVAAWDGKFHYWTARPNQFNPTLETVLPTYPIPDYPSAHAATQGGTSTVLAYLFPRDAHFFESRAAENAASRLWAGIHFRSACDAGLDLGRTVGQAVIDHAKQDGA